MAEKYEQNKARADELKEKATNITEMKHREKKTRAWKNISYTTKPFNHLGIFRLVIPSWFPLDDIKEMWDYLKKNMCKTDEPTSMMKKPSTPS